MGFWSEVAIAFGVRESKEARECQEILERLKAAETTGHHHGCDCHWCKCARLGAR